jgi:hypothetical protein
MRNIPFLRGQPFDPDALAVMDGAFQAVCRRLELTDAHDVRRQAAAFKVLEIAQAGHVRFGSTWWPEWPSRGLADNENARALISMVARSTTSNQRPDTLTQDRTSARSTNSLAITFAGLVGAAM